MAAPTARRFGVEEEFLLLDEATGIPRDGASELIRAVPQLQPEHEYFESQIEMASPVCDSAADAERALADFRGGVSAAAAELGLVLAGTGAPVIGGETPGTVTDKPRYRAIESVMGGIATRYYSNGTHVHVEVPSREIGVEVLARFARWSPVLLALMANSPLWDGKRTGFACWRHLMVLQWPASGYPPEFADPDAYAGSVERLVESGVLLDPALVNWAFRLSERFPTVELRIADVQIDAEDAVAFAVLVRALVDRAIEEAEAGTPRQEIPQDLVRTAHWAAARAGLGGELFDALEGESRPAFDLVDELVRHAAPSLERAGDLEPVEALVARRREHGSPAEVQLRRFDEAGISGLLDLYRAGHS